MCDYLAHSLEDPETHTIILFVEGFKRPERFLALADRALELGKPILAVKVGRSSQAQEAAIAHSGSLAGEDRVTDAALAAAGVVRCADLDELLEAAELHAGCRRLGRSVGRGRTGVVTVSTGEASLIADLAAETGLDLPPVPEPARGGDPARPADDGLHRQPDRPVGRGRRGGLLPGGHARLRRVRRLRRARDRPRLPVPVAARARSRLPATVTRSLLDATRDRPDILPVFISLTSGEPTPEVQELLDAAGGVPLLRGAREAELAIARRAWWEARRSARLANGPARPTWAALAADRTPFGHDDAGDGTLSSGVGAASSPVTRALSEADSLALLRAAGIPVVEATLAADAGSAVAVARATGGPVALKLDAVGLVHKSDVGGVRLGLADPDEIAAAAAELIERGRDRGLVVRGVVVEPMASPGLELIVGVTRDPLFGPAVLVGFGGVFTEVLDDVAIRLAPITRDQALEMVETLRGAPLLSGARGGPPVDRGALADLIVALAGFAWERPDVVAVDLNPVIVGVDGAVAVDALVVLAGAARG